MKYTKSFPFVLLILIIAAILFVPYKSSLKPPQGQETPRIYTVDTIYTTSQEKAGSLSCELSPDRIRLWGNDSTHLYYELTLQELQLGVASIDKALFSPDSTKLILTFLVTEDGYTNSPPQVVVIDIPQKRVLHTYGQIFEAWITGIHPTNRGFYVFSREANFGASQDCFFLYSSDTPVYSEGGLYDFDILYTSDTSLIYYNDKSLINALQNAEDYPAESSYARKTYRDTLSLFDTEQGKYLWKYSTDALCDLSVGNYLHTSAKFDSDSTLELTISYRNDTNEKKELQRLYSISTGTWNSLSE